MEPLRPDLREALKEAHPGLTDDVIDEYENLTALRYKLDAGAFEESLAEIDRKRELLLKTRMPQFAQVAQLVSALRKTQTPRSETKFKLEILSDRERKADL